MLIFTWVLKIVWFAVLFVLLGVVSMLCCQIGNYQPYFDPVTLLISFPNPSYMFAT